MSQIYTITRTVTFEWTVTADSMEDAAAIAFDLPEAESAYGCDGSVLIRDQHQQKRARRFSQERQEGLYYQKYG